MSCLLRISTICVSQLIKTDTSMACSALNATIHHPQPGDLSAATATAAIARTKDLIHWDRLPDLKTKSQQRNVVLHPEFVDGKYAFYTRPQDGFIDTGSGGGIGWALVDDITHAEIKEEKSSIRAIITPSWK